MKKYKSFEETQVWQDAKSLALEVYKLTQNFPDSEKFGITSQIRRSSISICANIAEGFYRNSTKELIKFLYIARGSCGETICFLILSFDLGYVPKEMMKIYQDKCNSINKMLMQVCNFFTRKRF